MTVLGVAANFVFSGSLPASMAKFLDALGGAFTSLAPFTLGLSMVGRLGAIRGDAMLPILGLVLAKATLSIIIEYLGNPSQGFIKYHCLRLEEFIRLA